MMGDALDRPEWHGVVDMIERLLPYYERVNLAITFGLLPFWRERVARTAGEGGVVLEIGPGPGGFAERLHGRWVHCLDPSRPMLHVARRRLGDGRFRYLSGLAESLPLRAASVDRVYCSFSFRDFLDKPAAVREIARILRPGGEFHVLEAARPPPGLRRAFMDSWLNFGVPVVVRAFVPRSVRRTWPEEPYAPFVRTYAAMRPPETYGDLLRASGFERVELDYLAMRSVFHLRGVRARTT